MAIQTYSTVGDLLLGDMQLGSRIQPQRFVDDAAEEMNSRLGLVYVLPFGTLATYSASLLRLINNRIASGRLIMAMGVGGEDHSTQAYGQSLVDLGFADLGFILDSTILLDGGTRRVDTGRANAPSITNHDIRSAEEVFEAAVYHDPWAPFPWIHREHWRPGSQREGLGLDPADLDLDEDNR